MKILIVEPFYTESHKKWLDGLVEHSSHEISSLTLPGFHWKWRMHGAAVTLAQQFIEDRLNPDLIICTDMLDVNVFIGLLRKQIANIPVAIYFHENQITYPWSPGDQDVSLGRNRHYGFINYASALTADHVFFNSEYHRNSFLDGLGPYLNAFPDHKNLGTIEEIAAKSEVLYLGLDLSKFDSFINNSETKNDVPVILWNHRWEFDKNPDLFFRTLMKLKKESIRFQLIVLGRNYPKKPAIFDQARSFLHDEVIHWGYASDDQEYASLLCKADLLPVTSHQDFFGISVVEALYCECYPILPKRLAYPEHIDQEVFFYKNDEDFYEKLKYVLLNLKNFPKVNLDKVRSYDWEHQIINYDDVFSRLSANFARK